MLLLIVTLRTFRLDKRREAHRSVFLLDTHSSRKHVVTPSRSPGREAPRVPNLAHKVDPQGCGVDPTVKATSRDRGSSCRGEWTLKASQRRGREGSLHTVPGDAVRSRRGAVCGHSRRGVARDASSQRQMRRHISSFEESRDSGERRTSE